MSAAGVGAAARAAAAWSGRLLAGACDELYPRWCVLCGRAMRGCCAGSGRYLCHGCAARLPLIEPPLCPACGRPYGAVPEPPPRCRACMARGAGAGELEWVRSACRSAGGMRQMLHLFKYRRCRWLGPDLARIGARQLGRWVLAEGWDLLVPVPLHPRRERERGFNQAEELARHWGRAWAIPVCASSVRRARPTLPQATLRPGARRRNVVGAFRVVRPRPLRQRRLLLVDDVVTTGATLRELARALGRVEEGCRPARIGAITVGRGGL